VSTLAEAVAAATRRRVVSARRAGGGDINEAYAIKLDGGERLFVKTRSDAPPGEYAAEAAGLRWLAEPGALATADVVAVDDAFLALRWIDRGRLDAAGEEALGRGLAAVHAAGAPAFGGTGPLRLGAVTLPNDQLASWPEFYAERRLRPLARMAADTGALDAGGVRAVERVCERMSDLAGPPEPPARLHGDLWSGNVLAGADGTPHLIDPAAYGGHREIDLAMLRLFGSLGARVIPAYAEAAPLADGHERRVPLYQLLPLLVHAVLFGGGYGAAAADAARRAS